MQTAPLRITKLARQPEGYWTANVSCNGSTTPVDNRYGTWQGEAAPGLRRFVTYEVAVALQAKLPRAERQVAKR